jgi:RimJ/RimL family protein N-acetyltransferase
MTIAIRPYALGDAPALFEAATESIPDVFPWLPWCHPAYRLEEAQAWVEKQVGAFARAEEFEFVIQSPSGRFLGGCGINLVDRTHLRANLGYWVRSSAVGQGVAPAAAVMAADWAFAHTDLVRLEIITAVEHVRSQRVAEKTGALREGVHRRRLLLHGVHHDAVVFSLLRPAGSA